jgi:hypothetical protein
MMPELSLPGWPDGWVHFAGPTDLVFAASSLVLGLLMAIWWRQQTDGWFWILLATFAAGGTLAWASYHLFFVPPHFAGCPQGCAGWRGYPLPVAVVDLAGNAQVLPLDFAMNLLILWLLWLAASVIWRLLAMALRWEASSSRFKLLFVLLVGVLPWALLPRYFGPPQVEPSGEDLRLAINARRAAESTYGITGFWVQRLALEDIRRAVIGIPGPGGDPSLPRVQVCLRGYTYFYLPWRRYRIILDTSGVTALNLSVRSLDGNCWE